MPTLLRLLRFLILQQRPNVNFNFLQRFQDCYLVDMYLLAGQKKIDRRDSWGQENDVGAFAIGVKVQKSILGSSTFAS